jgi:ubiquitin C-terminal hydrolase
MALPSGLENRGNTCYLASAVQALAYCPPFLAFFLHGGEGAITAAVADRRRQTTFSQAQSGKTAPGELALQLLTLLQTLQAAKGRRVSPSAFVATVRAQNALFAGYEQHVSAHRLAKALCCAVLYGKINGLRERASSQRINGSLTFVVFALHRKKRLVCQRQRKCWLWL